MRLSEAILLGRSLVTPGPYEFEGCAWGMAAAAQGKNGAELAKPLESIGTWQDVAEVFGFPWAGRDVAEPPCPCEYIYPTTVAYAIAHLFDQHVFARADWTVERIAEWVSTIEPPELADAAVTREREAEAVGTVQCGQADPVEF